MRHGQFMVNVVDSTLWAVECESGKFTRAVRLLAPDDVKSSALAYDFSGPAGVDASKWKKQDLRNVHPAYVVKQLRSRTENTDSR